MDSRDGPRTCYTVDQQESEHCSNPVLHSGAKTYSSQDCYTVFSEPLPGHFGKTLRHCVTHSEDVDFSPLCNNQGSLVESHCVTGPRSEGAIADKALFRLARRLKGNGLWPEDDEVRVAFVSWLATRPAKSIKSSLDFLGDFDALFLILQSKFRFVKVKTTDDPHETSWRSSETSGVPDEVSTIPSPYIQRIATWLRDLQLISGTENKIWLSTPTIVEKLGGDRMGALRALRKLESIGLIRLFRKDHRGNAHHATEYVYCGNLEECLW